MGDIRFSRHLDRLALAQDAAQELRRMQDEDVIQALAAAARRQEPYLTNVLASEAENRMIRARVAMNGLSDGVLALDASGRITFANTAALILLGWDRGDLDRQGLDVVLPSGRDAKEVFRKLTTACGGEQLDDVVLARRNGTEFPARCNAARLVRDGVDVGVVVVFSDATRRKEREREERRRTALYASLLDAIGDLGLGVVVGDGERIVHANGVILDLLGQPIETLRAMPSVVALMDPSGLPAVQAHLARADARSGLSAPFVVQLLAKDGRRVPVEVRVRMVEVEGKAFFVAFVTEKTG